MRSEEEIISSILSLANQDDRIRAVILCGSRANEKIVKDDFQDFDVIFIVKELTSFQGKQDWIEVFGEKIILQMPNSMKIDENDFEADKNEITYLMLFKDWNRIDLTLIEGQDKDKYLDSLHKVLLDKEGLIKQSFEPSDQDFWVKKPSQKEFSDCSNEFWWLSTYVMKGLARNQVVYAKENLEVYLRKMFMKMLAWQVGIKTNFSINLGQHHRFLKQYVNEKTWKRILKTYPDSEIENIWNSLVVMMDMFHEIAERVAHSLDIKYNSIEADNVMGYAMQMKDRILK